MKNTVKLWMITAVALILIGCILFAVTMSALEWNFFKLSTVTYETNIYEISDPFDSISMNTDTADIRFVFSDGGICKVECYEEENAKHAVTVEDGTLTVRLAYEKTLHGIIGLNFESPKITVYLPEKEYSSLLIKESTGDIKIPNDFHFENVDISLSTGDVDLHAASATSVKLKASTGTVRVENTATSSLDLSVSTGNIFVSGVSCEGDIKVSVSTGKTQMKAVTCKNVISAGSTGEIVLRDVTVSETISVKRSTGDVRLNGSVAARIDIETDTGDVRFDGADAAEISIKTDTGDVEGSFLTDKIFTTKTNTGKIRVPESVSGGKCKITTDTGDIQITVP